MFSYRLLIPEQLNGKVKNKWIKIIFVMVMFGALLLTNKRAHILFTTAGAFLAYYIYNSDKPTKRIIKILGLLIIISVVCYLLYTIMPNMFEFLKDLKNPLKKQEVLQMGDTKYGQLP